VKAVSTAIFSETAVINEDFVAISIRSILVALVLGGALAGMLAGCTSTSQTASTTSAKFSRASWKILPQYKRQVVAYQTAESPGTIIVDTAARYLYLVEDGGKATRYGIGVGRQGFAWSGAATIKRKAEWPRWTPPAAMIARQPELAKYAGGMDGGIGNPLGARSLSGRPRHALPPARHQRAMEHRQGRLVGLHPPAQ
jgi:lipoprotein-anchoring transpeptidase ErfK/SrfK